MPQLSDDVILNMIQLIEQKTDEVKRLKQELADAQENNHFIQSMCASMRKELNTLKSEVDRLSAFTTTTIIPNEHMQSHVERMTKAGDAMAEVITEFRCGPRGNHVKNAFVVWNNWLAAKEGKQP